MPFAPPYRQTGFMAASPMFQALPGQGATATATLPPFPRQTSLSQAPSAWPGLARSDARGAQGAMTPQLMAARQAETERYAPTPLIGNPYALRGGPSPWAALQQASRGPGVLMPTPPSFGIAGQPLGGVTGDRSDAWGAQAAQAPQKPQNPVMPAPPTAPGQGYGSSSPGSVPWQAQQLAGRWGNTAQWSPSSSSNAPWAAARGWR